MSEHDSKSPRWRGNPRQYQLEAQRLWSLDHGHGLKPWSWVRTICEVNYCLDTSCMVIHSPVRIDYPRFTCVYCGEGCDGVDHLLPEPWTGDALRHLVAVVPACGNCNARIGDHPSPNVAERRQRAQLSIERANKNLLLRPIKTDRDLADLGHSMRSVALANNEKTERIRARLAWPIDPHYDLRAFQRSGIDDPESLGLCEIVSRSLRPEYSMEAAQ